MNYYQLPATCCPNRIGLLSEVNESDENQCVGLNPNKAYNYLFGSGNKIDEKYKNTYLNYNVAGKLGDYFCAFDSRNNICYPENTVTCEDTTTSDESSSQDVTSDFSTEVLYDSDVDVSINNFKINHLKGPDGNINLLATYDNDGYPELSRSSNPPQQNFMINEKYNTYPNKQIVNYNSMPDAPHQTYYKNVEDCKDWCFNNSDCKAVVAQNKFDPKCLYYGSGIENRTNIMQNCSDSNIYINKKLENIYPESVLDYTKSKINSKTPLKSNLNEIINPSAETSYSNYTSCMPKNKYNSLEEATIKISKNCLDNYGQGYVAKPSEFCKAKLCNSEEESYRFKCSFDPNNYTNVFNIDNNNCIESFKNKKKKSNKTDTFSIKKIIITFVLIIILFYILTRFIKK